MDIRISAKVDEHGKLSLQGWVGGAWFSIEGTPQQLYPMTPRAVWEQAERQLAAALHGIRTADIRDALAPLAETSEKAAAAPQDGQTPISPLRDARCANLSPGGAVCDLAPGHEGFCKSLNAQGGIVVSWAGHDDAAARCTDSAACARAGCDDCQRSYGGVR